MRLTIDNRIVDVKENTSILQAAEAQRIYLPHLCSHPDLTPYGGCRLCIVEVEGMRGYPTACTTLTEPGMIVRTQTKALQELRREILQMTLSEHPAACLICREAEECGEYQQTIRKVGLTTGCRWCSKDEDCELQKVVRSLQIEDITFPVYYREIPPENGDPFFDRDYNLCIYCGRCVRICQEHRKSSIIALQHRGRLTTIGPAFSQSHIEANCEFCGACVTVCPTGALAERNRKWHGTGAELHPAFCPLCSLRCPIQVLSKAGMVLGTLPPGDPHQAGGELCVKGRFCLSAWVSHRDRLLEPSQRFKEGVGIVSWEEAASQAGQVLNGVPGQRVAVFLSPFLTLEEMAAVKQFSQNVIGTPHVTSSVVDHSLVSYFSLFQKSAPLKAIERSDFIISIFLNGNHGYAPVTLMIKRAAEKGIRYCQIGWINDTTSRFADRQLRLPPGKEEEFFVAMLAGLQKKNNHATEANQIAAAVAAATAPVIIVGAEILNLKTADRILQTIEKIIDLTKARLFAVHPYGDLTGLFSLLDIKSNEDIHRRIAAGEIDVLYLVCDNQWTVRPPVKSIIYQHIFPPADGLTPDLVLPAATFAEFPGSHFNDVGARKKFPAAGRPPGKALTHQAIFSLLAKAMGKKGVSFTAGGLSRLIPEKAKPVLPEHEPSPPPKSGMPPPGSGITLIQEHPRHLYHDIRLNSLIADLHEIAPLDTILLNPDDARKLGIDLGDSVEVKSRREAKTFPASWRKSVPAGFAYLNSSAPAFVFTNNPLPVTINSVSKINSKKATSGRRRV